MKILDRYIVKQYLWTIVFSLVAFTALFTVVDLMEKLDDFIDRDAPATLVAKYYLVFIPDILKLMTPVAALFGSLFTAGKMGNQMEITAIKAGGVSFYRFMVPIVAVSTLISAFSIYFGGYFVPDMNKHKLHIERVNLKKHLNVAGANLFFQDGDRRLVRVGYYNPNTGEAVRASVQEFADDDLTVMTVRHDLQRMRYDSASGEWIGVNGVWRKFDERGEKYRLFVNDTLRQLGFMPDELATKQQRVEEMTLDELDERIESARRAGHDPTRLVIEYHARFAFAFTPIVVVLFGLPLSANRRKSGLALQFGINTLIAFLYLGMMQIIQAFGKNGSLDPLLTAWLVNIVFLVGAAFNLVRVRN